MERSLDSDSEVLEHDYVVPTENLSGEVFLKAGTLDDSAIFGHTFKVKVFISNMSSDTLRILTGFHTLYIESVRDTSYASVLDSIERQTNKRVLVTQFSPDRQYPEVINSIESNALFNSSTGLTTLLPLDTLSDTITFNCTAPPGLNHRFRLVYDTENYNLYSDSAHLITNIPRISTGKLISDLIFMDILQPDKDE